MAVDESHKRMVSAELLSGRSWTELLAFLSKGAADTGAAYEKIRERLCKFFQYKGSFEPEQLTDATLNRVARLLHAGQQVREDEPAKYVLGVARLVYLETVKREVRAKKSIKDAPPAPDVQETSERERHATALEHCLSQLSTKDREVILVYHEGRGRARIDRRGKLAQKLGVPLNTLRIRAYRIRNRLQDCLRSQL